jgi:uncharacterized protein YjbI with pentapeptide repeats
MLQANLRRVKLRGAKLQGWDPRGSDLCGADLTDTDLRTIGLHRVFRTVTRYDAHTRWPQGFDPQRHGAVGME